MIFLQNLTIFSIFWLSNLLFLTYNLIFWHIPKVVLFSCYNINVTANHRLDIPNIFTPLHLKGVIMKKLNFICKQKLVQRCCVCCSFCCNSIMFTLVLPGRIRRASNEFKSLPRLKHDWSFSELFPILRIGRWFQWQNN